MVVRDIKDHRAPTITIPTADVCCCASVFTRGGWELFAPRDGQGGLQQDTKVMQNGTRWSSSDTLCTIATTAAIAGSVRLSARAAFARQIKHYPVVELTHDSRRVTVACVHIHFQSTAAEFGEVLRVLFSQGVTVVGGDFNTDLKAHGVFGTGLFGGGDIHSPSFPTDTRGPPGNTAATRIDFVVTLDSSVSSVQRVSTAISNKRRGDGSFEHSDHRAVEALVYFS